MEYQEILNKIVIFLRKYKDHILIGTVGVLFLFILFTPRHRSIEPPTKVLKEVEHIKDVNEKLYAKLEQQVSERDKTIDSLAKALKLKPKHIKGETKVVVRTDTAFIDRVTPIYTGSDTAYMVEKHDPWIDVVAVAGKDTGYISLSHRDTLTRVEVVKTYLLRPTERFILLRNSSPYNKVQSGYSWTTKEKSPFITIGFGFSVVPVKPYVLPSINVSKPIVTFYK